MNIYKCYKVKKGNSQCLHNQKNEKEIIKLQGELKLINNKIDTIKNNHLQHIDYKINNIYKLIWLILTISVSGLVNLVDYTSSIISDRQKRILSVKKVLPTNIK